jgi:hypothetical protein
VRRVRMPAKRGGSYPCGQHQAAAGAAPGSFAVVGVSRQLGVTATSDDSTPTIAEGILRVADDSLGTTAAACKCVCHYLGEPVKFD